MVLFGGIGISVIGCGLWICLRSILTRREGGIYNVKSIVTYIVGICYWWYLGCCFDCSIFVKVRTRYV